MEMNPQVSIPRWEWNPTDSFPSGSIELILHLSGSGASKTICWHFCTHQHRDFILFVVPMESWFVVACPVNFGPRVDQFSGDQLGEFDNFHPFS
jgi:hypothetical protein